MKKLITMIKNIVKIARMVSADDTGDYRYAEYQYYGRTTKGLLFSPYGLLVNPPTNSMAVLLSQNALESNIIGMCDDPKNRTLRNLAIGEVALSNYIAEQYLHFKENGDAELKADKAIITIGGTTVTIENGQVTVDGADTTLNGNLQVNGDIGATGDANVDGEITADAAGAGVSLTTHTTDGVTPGSGVSGPPTPGT